MDHTIEVECVHCILSKNQPRLTRVHHSLLLNTLFWNIFLAYTHRQPLTDPHLFFSAPDDAEVPQHFPLAMCEQAVAGGKAHLLCQVALCDAVRVNAPAGTISGAAGPPGAGRGHDGFRRDQAGFQRAAVGGSDWQR